MGGGDIAGHVLRETTSRDCIIMYPEFTKVFWRLAQKLIVSFGFFMSSERNDVVPPIDFGRVRFNGSLDFLGITYITTLEAPDEHL